MSFNSPLVEKKYLPLLGFTVLAVFFDPVLTLALALSHLGGAAAVRWVAWFALPLSLVPPLVLVWARWRDFAEIATGHNSNTALMDAMLLWTALLAATAIYSLV